MLKDHAARLTGFAGSCLIALGGLGAGALPVGIPFFAGLKHVRIGLFAVYGGLMLLLLAWWWLGRLSAAGDTRAMWRTAALWSAPLLVAPPMFSRDVYSYLAQGLMLGDGMDVYRAGPSALGGFFAEQVPAIWQHTPSPYGPVFLLTAQLVTAPIGGHLLTGVVAMRLLAVGGLALLAYVLPTLATSAGVPPHKAVWLAVLNPLVLIHFVGGAHNDALMVGLLAAGLAAAVRNRPLVATLLIVAAGLIKAPAVLGLVAVAVIWASRIDGRLPRLRASAAVGATAAAATALLTQIAGTGYGWIAALDTPISPQNLSLTSVLGRWTAGLLREDGVGEVFALNLWRWLGVLATLVVAGLVWACLDRLGPLYGLGLVLIALVAFGPALRPWYLIWGLAPLAAAAGHRWVRRALAAVCGVMTLVVLPDGFAVDGGELLLATLGGLAGCAAFLVVRLAAAPAADRLVPARAAR
ncbi:polyprenol phosphomannose-dependent alpha 1,6 mannosyltransferase MptB [Paractinoplanes hotanensis]|uniref:Polyprenol phosphomannose-dependent alpha 1,6 mannosyltransferase MptB n=1 Tax=Paractinoplanes hotanensis TaxID=2906497 RepID=A0ABT0Y5Y2_9ACTN|nr:polyprenol phosphomannose-dependent alpha 1,6 mannosyltransferase MptB [Actinoplanes hotanensis]MCM4080734.1 polyprenol phosphomannose-dependent alpha 1,6 mannosyltransferase MptB [Actinoplanes hotanensis]